MMASKSAAFISLTNTSDFSGGFLPLQSGISSKCQEAKEIVAPLSLSMASEAVWHPEAYVLWGMMYTTFLPVKSGISVGIAGAVGIGADVAVGSVVGVALGAAVGSSVRLTSCSAGLQPARIPATTANLIKSRLLIPPEHSQAQSQLLLFCVIVPPNLGCVITIL
jgi:hypothetical protein